METRNTTIDHNQSGDTSCAHHTNIFDLLSQILAMMEDTSTGDEYKYQYTERLRRLLQIEGSLSDDFRSALNDCSEMLLEGDFMDSVDYFFHNDLDADKHSEEDVRALVRCMPSVLRQDSKLLLHLTRRVESVPFIPVVAEEAIQMNYYEDPSLRGVLLCKDRYMGTTVIDLLCHGHDPVRDPVYLATIRRLREMDLLKKEDIRSRELLFCCGQAFVDFFADWDPGALKTRKNAYDNCYIHHESIAFLAGTGPDSEDYKNEILFAKQIIKASFKHYPDELGLLMLRNDEGGTVWENLSDLMGSQEAWEIIKNSINCTSNDKVLEEETSGEDQNVNVSFAPLFTAAVSEELTDDLCILYHLLRKEPAKWITFLGEEPDTKRRPRDDDDDATISNEPVSLGMQEEISWSRVAKRSKKEV